MLLFARYGWCSRRTIVAMNNFYRNMAGTSKSAKSHSPSLIRASVDFSNPDKSEETGYAPQIMAWG